MDSSTVYREALPGIEQIRVEFPPGSEERARVPLQHEYGAMVVEYSVDATKPGNELVVVTLALLGPVGVWRGSAEWKFHTRPDLADPQEAFRLETFGTFLCRPGDDLSGLRLPILGRVVGAVMKQGPAGVYISRIRAFSSLPKGARGGAIAACGPASPLYRPMLAEAARPTAEGAGR